MRVSRDIYEVLGELAIAYRKFEHPPVCTVEEASQHRGRLPGAQIKSLFLRNKRGDRHYLVVAEASRRIDLRRLREKCGEAALSFASPERLLTHLGVTPGAVSAFALVNDRDRKVVVIVDRNLLSYDAAGFHPNVNTATLVISTADFRRFLEHCGNEVRFLDLAS